MDDDVFKVGDVVMAPKIEVAGIKIDAKGEILIVDRTGYKDFLGVVIANGTGCEYWVDPFEITEHMRVSEDGSCLQEMPDII